MCTDLTAYLIKLYHFAKFWDLIWYIKNDIYDSDFRLNDCHNFVIKVDDNYKYVKKYVSASNKLYNISKLILTWSEMMSDVEKWCSNCFHCAS